MSLIQKVKALFVLKDAIKEIKEANVKSGWKTTEFALTAIGALLSVWFAVSGMIDPKTSALIVAAVTMIYTIARAIVKFTPSTKDDEILAKIEETYNSKKK